MTSPLFDVIAVNIKTLEKRVLETGKTKENAEAIVKMAVMRRGVEEEFYKTVPHELEQEPEEQTRMVIKALVEECGWTEDDARAFVAENPREGGNWP